MNKKEYSFDKLLQIMSTLRSENGCPWDREQNHETLKKYLIEETYEVLDAIDSKDPNKLAEELGDLLLQIVFHAQIGVENQSFNIDTVISEICIKMINRHPHVFGNQNLTSADQVIENWEKIKKLEKNVSTQTDVLKNVPQNLPALIRSYKVQQKAADVGFDWDNADDIFNKIEEETQELKDAYLSKNIERITDELGDALFSIVNLARFLNIHPELALTSTINKFIKRFEYIEKEASKKNKPIEKMSLKEMDELWEHSKLKT